MVQSVLINLAELGLAADLVRHGDIKRRGPTIASVSILASTLLAVLMWIGAGPFTRAMDAPEAAPVIGVMALTLPLAGLTAVPYARLQRDFMQGKLFMIDASNFVVGTSVTVVLAASGHGSRPCCSSTRRASGCGSAGSPTSLRPASGSACRWRWPGSCRGRCSTSTR
jgi:lipopolysaccharide exporter